MKQVPIEDIYFTMLTLLKNETGHEHSSFPMSSSLKNETNPLLVKVESFI